MTPKLARVLVIAAAALAVLVAALDRDEPAGAVENELTLRYLYYPDAEDLLAPLIARFNRETHTSGGREIRIDGVPLTSGEAEKALGTGAERAALWTPASSHWGELLNHRVGARWVPASNPSLVTSPQVIAMWEPLARALGWRPDGQGAQIGWKDILALASSKRGWAELGLPEWGAFRLGHTNPDFSTSGLSAVASEYYAVTGKQRGLTLADVGRADVREAVRAIERSIVHYGERASDLTSQMDLHGPNHVHAVYVQETTVHEYNEERQQETALIPIIPADGTFIADYPLIALEAPSLRAEERAGARLFRSWLKPRIAAKAAADGGFRMQRPRGLTELEWPEPKVLDAIRSAWREDRKPANIVLVVDSSESMGKPRRLDAAREGLLSFVRALSPEDRVALITTGEKIERKVALGPPQRSSAAVAREVRRLVAKGAAPIYPAISEALLDVRAIGDASRINAVVVLTDGASTNVGRGELLRAIADESVTEGTSVRIFTVAYGESADTAALRNVAQRSGGAFFSGGPSDIKDVYLRISSYF